VHPHITTSMLVAIILVATIILLLSGRTIVRILFRPLRRIVSVLGRKVIQPVYSITLRPLIRLLRRMLRLASSSTPPGGVGAEPYKALVHLLEMNSLAKMALGEVPDSIKSLVDRKGVWFKSVNANRAVETLPDTLTLDEAKRNMAMTDRYYQKTADGDQVSPSILYEDSEEALIIEILRESDLPYFWVLREIRHNTGRNVVKIISVMTLLLVLFPFVLDVFAKPGLTIENAPWYALTIVVFVLLLTFLRYVYGNSARYNGQYFNHFIQSYFSRLLNQYKSASAAFSQILNDRTTRLDSVETNSSIWFVNMHWLSARQWLLELYEHNIVFQIARDWLWHIITVPIMMGVFWFAIYFGLSFLVGEMRQDFGPLPALAFSWSWWTVVPSLGLVLIYLVLMRSLIELFWNEVDMRAWPSYRSMGIREAIERNIGAIVREVVDKRRNPYGQQMPPPPG
jgi:hypothetical protein